MVSRWASRADNPRLARDIRTHALVTIAVAVAAGVVALGCLLIPNPFVAAGAGVVSATFAASMLLIRAGRTDAASLVSTLTIVGVVQAVVLITGRPDLAPTVLVTVLVVVALTTTVRRALWMTALTLLVVASWYPLLPAYTTPTSQTARISLTLLMLLGVSTVALVGVWNRERDRAQIESASSAARSLAEHLAAVNAELESRVAERTRELEAALLEQRRLVEELDELAQRDDLTGLHNRRHLLAAMGRPAVRDNPHCLLIADLDHFKRINDRFGHPAGDSTLRSVAAALLTAVPDDAVVARIGGEEFAILLAGTLPEQGLAHAEQLRATVATVPGPGGHRLSLSVGVSDCEGRDCVLHAPDADHRDLLIRRADSALYRAKSLGRNRVELAPRPVLAASAGREPGSHPG